MRVHDALGIIAQISYKPGWRITATDYTKRHEGAVKLHVEYQARNSDRDKAPDYSEWVSPAARADFAILVSEARTPLDIWHKVFAVLMDIEYHEAREFFGVNGADYDKPFHPHTMEGLRNWAHRSPVFEQEASVTADLRFGSV